MHAEHCGTFCTAPGRAALAAHKLVHCAPAPELQKPGGHRTHAAPSDVAPTPDDDQPGAQVVGWQVIAPASENRPGAHTEHASNADKKVPARHCAQGCSATVLPPKTGSALNPVGQDMGRHGPVPPGL